jgi:hypothetical protein
MSLTTKDIKTTLILLVSHPTMDDDAHAAVTALWSKVFETLQGMHPVLKCILKSQSDDKALRECVRLIIRDINTKLATDGLGVQVQVNLNDMDMSEFRRFLE